MIHVLQEGKQPEIEITNEYAIVAITKHGVMLARKLQRSFTSSDLFYMKKFGKGDEQEKNIQMFEGSVRLLLPSLFNHYKGIVLIISLGAVVRMIAPLLKDKKTDPGIVVLDDKGQFAISVLSGHMGGANELTREIAALIGAESVITTASDVQKTIPVDLFGKRFGWVWDSAEKLTPVSASVVNEEHVAIVQESGERNWWEYDRPIPENIRLYGSIQEAQQHNPDAALIVTHRNLCKDEEQILKNGVLYRPKVIILGIGCNRGTSAEEIQSVIQETLDELKFSIKSVKGIATIDLKKDEAGLLETVSKYDWSFTSYTPEELNNVTISEPSQTVFSYTGAYGVSEPAARLASGASNLALVKKKSGNVTISVAVIPY
ncbi:cobalt-precorrin 5A hydrolase [Fictibacillus barbaricus]|uniref:Cobalamin biosynthesis protein n=1 Tax=Fictibacillus barbaricus TaxID=182136 RepID=A0ABS2ZB89_9BACL|nr:cobalamin biosynthesis protein [Fictibacillus barbaricus]MBN3545468.1 cobalamin biosynthesis protein [Fictibacillus barbaricus]GGB53664.1 cobalamin biosynthesis protein [Fictibacillus barbaricus]